MAYNSGGYGEFLSHCRVAIDRGGAAVIPKQNGSQRKRGDSAAEFSAPKDLKLAFKYNFNNERAVIKEAQAAAEESMEKDKARAAREERLKKEREKKKREEERERERQEREQKARREAQAKEEEARRRREAEEKAAREREEKEKEKERERAERKRKAMEAARREREQAKQRELVNSFKSFCPGETNEVAHHYLDSANWSLESAVTKYYNDHS